MTDLVIVPASVIAGANSTQKDGIAGQAVTAGQVLYLDPTTAKWLLADNNNAVAKVRKPTGIALNGAALNQPVRVHKSGDITIGVAVVAGTAYYLSGAPGGICARADVVAGMDVCFIGIAKDAAIITVDFQTPLVTL